MMKDDEDDDDRNDVLPLDKFTFFHKMNPIR